jgi:tetratricopeptide (TPR) repeat protein
MLLSNGDLKGSLPLASEALARAQRLEDGTMQRAVAYRTLGQIHHACGEYQQARTVLRQSISLAESLGTVESYNRALVGAQAWLTLASADLGLFQEGQQLGEEVMEIARRTDSQWSVVSALACVGYLHLRRGSLEVAIRVLEPGHVLCRTFGMVVYLVPIGALLAFAYALSGRPDEARDVLDQSQKLAISIKTSHWHSLWFVLLAEAFAAAGQRQEARESAKRALDLARAQGAQGYEAYALRTLGDSHEAQEADETEAYYRRSMRLSEELGMRPLFAHCHTGLAKLYRRTGKQRRAEEHFTTATTMYREMGMTYWLEKVEREMREGP